MSEGLAETTPRCFVSSLSFLPSSAKCSVSPSFFPHFTFFLFRSSDRFEPLEKVFVSSTFSTPGHVHPSVHPFPFHVVCWISQVSAVGFRSAALCLPPPPTGR